MVRLAVCYTRMSHVFGISLAAAVEDQPSGMLQKIVLQAKARIDDMVQNKAFLEIACAGGDRRRSLLPSMPSCKCSHRPWFTRCVYSGSGGRRSYIYIYIYIYIYASRIPDDHVRLCCCSRSFEKLLLPGAEDSMLRFLPPPLIMLGVLSLPASSLFIFLLLFFAHTVFFHLPWNCLGCSPFTSSTPFTRTLSFRFLGRR